MANQLTPIASTVLTSTAASVTFASISGTFTDLMVKWSARSDNAGSNLNVNMGFNSDTGANYSLTFLRGSGSAASSDRGSGSIYITETNSLEGTGYTTSTFAVAEILIPNYTLTTTRPTSSFVATENNAAGSYIEALAGQYRGAAAITSILLTPSAGNFVSGSRFDLYGLLHA
jgi:hypothetical protein